MYAMLTYANHADLGADEIIVMEEGRVLERGTHLELVQLKGKSYVQRV